MCATASWEHQGIRFRYADRGEGRPFVFQHGLGGERSQALELCDERPGLRLIAMDCRGHGETVPLGDANRLRFDVFADDVVALLDHLGIERFVAGGISMGAGVALNLALRFPRRVDGLLLVRPAWLAQPAPPNLDGMVAVGRALAEHGVEQGRTHFRASALYRRLAEEAPYTADTLLAQFDEARAADAWPRLLHLPADAPNRDPAAWRTLPMPALVLGNRNDYAHPYAYAETLAAAIPGARLVEVPSKAVDKAAHTTAARRAIAHFLNELL